MLLWLSDRAAAALAFAKHYLLTHTAPANTDQRPEGHLLDHRRSVRADLGLHRRGRRRPRRCRTRRPARPDLVGIAQHGVVYTGGVKKIAEHGGGAADDRDVPLVVSGAGVRTTGQLHAAVETTQIAPTILALLGPDPHALQAVRTEHTAVLPAL